MWGTRAHEKRFAIQVIKEDNHNHGGIEAKATLGGGLSSGR
jgi:hypothetical protein